MGTTTFSGPIRAGTIKSTTGTTLGTDVNNVGEVVLSQHETITQATNGVSAGVYTTSIVLPANSTITSIQLYVTAIWSGAATTLGVGTTASATRGIPNKRWVGRVPTDAVPPMGDSIP